MLLHKYLADNGFNLILASQSPRRRQLMADSGLEFRTVQYDIEEIYPEELAAKDVPQYLSQLKSNAFPDRLEERDILITADTVVLLHDGVLGKPKDKEAAHEMLRSLSGKAHIVVTGVTIRTSEGTKSFSSTTNVRFAELSEDQIEYYVDMYKPYDKAGSYGIQEWIGYVGIEGIDGSFYNVMGLPIQRLCSELSLFIQSIY